MWLTLLLTCSHQPLFFTTIYLFIYFNLRLSNKRVIKIKNKKKGWTSNELTAHIKHVCYEGTQVKVHAFVFLYRPLFLVRTTKAIISDAVAVLRQYFLNGFLYNSISFVWLNKELFQNSYYFLNGFFKNY
jgi:hypothetical protein